MAEKTRYSDAELEEFRAIILEKLEVAKKDYELLRSGVTNSDGNDVADTSPTFKVLEEGASTLQRRGRTIGATADEVYSALAGCACTHRK